MTLVLWAGCAFSWASVVWCGGWTYAYHRAHDGDQYRYGRYAQVSLVCASGFGATALIVG